MTDGDRGSLLAQPLRLPRPSAGRIAAYVGLFALGLLTGIAGALLEGAWFPGGLLLALAGSAGAILGGSLATGTRGGGVAVAAGWMLSVILLTTSRPEGDFVFAAGAGSYLFLLGGMAVAVICATLGPGRQPHDRSARLGK